MQFGNCSASESISVLGGRIPLVGEIEVEGSKNSALPLLVAASLFPGLTAIRNVPNIRDVSVQLEILNVLGCDIRRSGSSVFVSQVKLATNEIPPELTRLSRGSIYASCVPLAEGGMVRFEGIGGDELERTLEPHFRAFRGFGLDIERDNKWIVISGQLRANSEFILEDRVAGISASVLSLLLASRADGRTIIHGASREPEVVEVARFLIGCGAQISWDGTTVIVNGPATEKPAIWCIPPDRVVWGTLAAAVVSSSGRVEMPTLPPDCSASIFQVFADAGMKIVERPTGITISAERLYPVRIETGPFPMFPSDLGPAMSAVMAIAPGESRLVENVYPERFDHIKQLMRSGLRATISENNLIINGGAIILGDHWRGSGIRETAALLLIGLLAQGQSHISNASAMNRGYEDLSRKLSNLGANVAVTRL